ncbi:hypothetical protein D3C84_493980 [compost metagenome]
MVNDDAREQAADKLGQGDAGIDQQQVESIAEHQGQVEPHPRPEHVVVVQCLARLLLENADFQLRIPGRRQAMTIDQTIGDRAANHASGDQAHGVAGDPQFMGVTDAQFFDEDRCPGQGGAYSTGKGNRAHHQTRLGIETKGFSHTHAQRVLQNNEYAGEHQQDQQRASTFDELAHVRSQTNTGKEVEQQRVADLQIEFDLNIEAEVQERRYRRTDEPADHRFGNAVLA